MIFETFLPDLIIEATNVCNMTCKGCYAPNVYLKTEKSKIRHLNVGLLKDTWKFKSKVARIAIRGGEPSLNPELPSIIDFLSTRTDEIFLETNGKWICNNQNLLKCFADNNVIVKLSVDEIHKSSSNFVNECISILNESGVRHCVAITSRYESEAKLVFSNLLKGYVGNVYWQRLESSSDHLVRPKLGVIATTGIFYSQPTNNLPSLKSSLGTLFVFILALFLSDFAIAEKLVKIGIAANFSAMSSNTSNPFSNHFRNGVKLALDKKAKQLEKQNIKIEVSEFDYGESASKVLESANQAVQSEVLAVMGYIYSSDVFIAGPVFQKAGLLMLTPTGSADRIDELGRYVRRSCFNDSAQGSALASYAYRSRNIKRVGIISVSDCSYCQSLRSSFSRTFKELGGVVAIDELVLSNQDDLTLLISKFKDQKLDAILLPNYERISATLMAKLIDGGISPNLWMGGDGWGNSMDLFQKIVGLREYKAITVSHWHSDYSMTKSKDFILRFRNEFKRDPIDTSVLAYDATLLLIESILAAKSLSRAGIIESIEQIKNFDGAAGSMIYSLNLRTPVKTIALLKSDSGKVSLEKVINP